MPARLHRTNILQFGLISAGVFVALSVLAPTFHGLQQGGFRGLVSSIGGFGKRAIVHVQTRTETIMAGQSMSVDCDLSVALANRNTNNKVILGLEREHHFFLPLAAMIALAVATPGRVSRRCWVLAMSLICLMVLLWLRLWLLFGLTLADPAVAALQWPAWVKGVAQTFVNALIDPPASRIVLPLLIWVVVAFRVRDWIIVEEISEDR